MKLKNEKGTTKEEQQDAKAGAVDQIKKKYGFPTSSVSFASMHMSGNDLKMTI